MTVLQRAATLAAISFSLAGLIGTSTPGLAFEIDRTAIPASATAVDPNLVNTLTPAEVPSAMSIAPTSATDTQDYVTLAAAVAAQDAPLSVGDDNLQCLAGAVYFESKGEPLSGQLAVAEVIINRAKSGRFADDVCSVVKQRGQFSFVRGGRIPSIDGARAAYRTALAVAKVALGDMWDSPAPKALYFHARRAAPGWGLTKVASIGNHIFYR